LREQRFDDRGASLVQGTVGGIVEARGHHVPGLGGGGGAVA
jgi:hypothetical protein